MRLFSRASHDEPMVALRTVEEADAHARASELGRDRPGHGSHDSRRGGVLAAMPVVAFFVPALVYLADTNGTQTEAIAVRGLSLSRMSLWHVLGGELRTGPLIGLVLSLLAFPMVWLAFGDVRLAFAVSASLGAASTVASLMGLLLPWMLGRLGTDPAYGSGPLATILQDVMTLLMYLGFASFIVVQSTP